MEKEMATHSSLLAWRIPWTEEPGRLQSIWSQSRARLTLLSMQAGTLVQNSTQISFPSWVLILKFLGNSLVVQWLGLGASTHQAWAQSLVWGMKVPQAMKVKVKSLSRVRLFATPWTVARQAPLSMGFARQEYWSGLSFSSPTQGSNPRLLHLQADSLLPEPSGNDNPSNHNFPERWTQC